MSKEAQEYDRDAALANLTDEERAALEDDDLSPEEKAALEDIAGDDDDDGGDDGGEDSASASSSSTSSPSEAEAAAPTKKAEDDAKPAKTAEAAADDDADEFRSSYQVSLPDDFNDQVKALDEREAELSRKFKAGEIEADEFLTENKAISGERSKLDRIATKAEIASEMGEQTELQRWNWTVERFMREVKKAEGIDYKAEQDGIGVDLDAFVKVLANNPANADKPAEWFLQEAHKRTKALHGLTDKKPDANEKGDAKKKAAAERKPDTSKLPASLAQVPGGDGPGDVGDEFADIDKLDGLAYEQALAKMTPAQRERYLATA